MIKLLEELKSHLSKMKSMFGINLYRPFRANRAFYPFGIRKNKISFDIHVNTKKIDTGLNYFLNKFTEKERETLNIDRNPNGVGLDIEIPFANRKFIMECGFYNSNWKKPGLITSVDIVNKEKYSLCLKTGLIPSHFPSNIQPADIIPEDYDSGKYLKILTGTKGIDLNMTYQIISPLTLGLEHINLWKLNNSFYLMREKIRLNVEFGKFL